MPGHERLELRRLRAAIWLVSREAPPSFRCKTFNTILRQTMAAHADVASAWALLTALFSKQTASHSRSRPPDRSIDPEI